MKRMRTENRLLSQIEIIDIAEDGKGVGKTDNLVVFVEKAIPGDVVDAELYRKKKNFGEARIIELIKASPYRTEAFCQHFGTCGGCKWQHMEYEAQLKFKQKSVIDALERIAGVDTSHASNILPSFETRYYRNKLEFTFSNKRWLTDKNMPEDGRQDMDALGFHIPLRFDKILNIETCYLQPDPSNEIRNQLRDFAMKEGISFYDLRQHEGSLRNLIVRTASTGEIMVIVVFAYPLEGEAELVMSFLKERFPQITSLLYIINQKKNDTIFDQEVVTYWGKDYIREEMPALSGGKNLTFKIGPKSFYQTNSLQTYELYRIALDFAELQGNELVYDLYTGTGTIAAFAAGRARQVIGIEYVPEAIENARENSLINGIKNTVFYAGDMKDVLTPDFINHHGKPEVIITDPPRAGMHADVVKRLLEIEAGKIVYVSCNAATQARDIGLLKEKYEMKRIQPVDMFPHTQHVENVVLLTLKS